MTKISSRPEVTFKGTDGKTTIETKVDTGADRTSIDHRIAARIGAGPVVKSVKVNTATGQERRPVAKVWVELEDYEELLAVSLADRKGKSTDAILGKEVLHHFDISIKADK